MSLQLRWVGTDEQDRVALTRTRCYAPAMKETGAYRDRLQLDGRAVDGDFLLAERDGQAVGTTTSLSMTMWARGRALPCQGVAWVGTIRTQRRGGSGGERGVASQLMLETLRRARERGQVVSALMPFRASYYEHFGYGIVETRNVWTLPMPVLPTGDFGGMRFFEEGDLPRLRACRQRVVERGQCDIETSDAGWALRRAAMDGGFVVVDDRGDRFDGWLCFLCESKDGKAVLRVADQGHADVEALRRQLALLASLRDQYSLVTLTLPRDVPLNHLLRETQLPHRPVDHPAATLHPHTRMQIRVLDHVRFFDGMPAAASGRVVVAVRECEGHESRFRLEFDGGVVRAAATEQSPQATASDAVWASIASGHLPASTAAQWGLLSAEPAAAALLDALSVGPAPFCGEYF